MIAAVFPNLDKFGSSDMVEKIGALLNENGIEAYLPDSICCSHYKNMDEDDLFKIADVIITVGGDGTIIRFAKRAAATGKPIVGINAGRMGYLADIEQHQYKLLSKLKTNDYTVEDRMMLSVTAMENGKVIGEYQALNDAVITSGFISRLIDISVSSDGEPMKCRADGMIVSTPSGSTAYSMAAGGPVIDPKMDCMLLTPICSHMLYAKPMVFGADKTMKLKAVSKKRVEIYLVVDGRKVLNIKPYTEIYIKKCETPVKLIRLKSTPFYKTLTDKFADVRSGNIER